jgi:hypothetical protein
LARSVSDTTTRKKAAPAINNELTDEEREALYLKHLNACEEQDEILADATAGMKLIRSARNKTRNAAQNDGFPLAMLDRVLKKRRATSQRQLEVDAELEHWMNTKAGVPVGGQYEMFAKTPAEVKDALDYENEGRRMGLAGKPCEAPFGMHPRFKGDFDKGWMDGQKRLVESGAVVTKLEERRHKDALGEPVVAPEPAKATAGGAEKPTVPDPAEVEAGAKALKAAGFTSDKKPKAEPVH